MSDLWTSFTPDVESDMSKYIVVTREVSQILVHRKPWNMLAVLDAILGVHGEVREFVSADDIVCLQTVVTIFLCPYTSEGFALDLISDSLPSGGKSSVRVTHRFK